MAAASVHSVNTRSWTRGRLYHSSKGMRLSLPSPYRLAALCFIFVVSLAHLPIPGSALLSIGCSPRGGLVLSMPCPVGRWAWVLPALLARPCGRQNLLIWCSAHGRDAKPTSGSPWIGVGTSIARTLRLLLRESPASALLLREGWNPLSSSRSPFLGRDTKSCVFPCGLPVLQGLSSISTPLLPHSLLHNTKTSCCACTVHPHSPCV